MPQNGLTQRLFIPANFYHTACKLPVASTFCQLQSQTIPSSSCHRPSIGWQSHRPNVQLCSVTKKLKPRLLNTESSSSSSLWPNFSTPQTKGLSGQEQCRLGLSLPRPNLLIVPSAHLVCTCRLTPPASLRGDSCPSPSSRSRPLPGLPRQTTFRSIPRMYVCM